MNARILVSLIAAAALAVGCSDNGGTGTSTSGSSGSTSTSTGGSGSSGSSGGSSGSGGSTGGASVNGCTAATATDMTGQSAVTINFGGNAGSPAFGYAPACIKVGNGAGGVQVTFAGNFSAHPLKPGTDCVEDTNTNSSNPITSTNTGTSKTFSITPAGAVPYTVPYFCAFHCASSGMKGAIFVQ